MAAAATFVVVRARPELLFAVIFTTDHHIAPATTIALPIGVPGFGAVQG